MFFSSDTLLLQYTNIIPRERTCVTTLLIYLLLCGHPLLCGWAGWERDEWQEEEEEEEAFDRNGHLHQDCSLLCTHNDSCQLCSRSPEHTAAAHYTHPCLTEEKDKELSSCIQRDSCGCAGVAVCGFTCLALVTSPAKLTSTLVGS